MNFFTQKQAINILFAIGFIALMVSTYYAHEQSDKVLETNNWVIHTYQVIDNIDNINQAISDVESQASFQLLLNHPSLSIALTTSQQNIHNQLVTLKNLTNDNPNQQTRIQTLENNLRNKFLLLNNIFANLPQAQDKSEYITAANVKRLAIKNQSLQILSAMKNEELNLLATRTTALSQDLRKSRHILSFIISIGTIIFLFSYIFLNYYLTQRDNVKKALIDANKSLHESENRFRLATEGSNAGLWDWQPGTNKVFYSSSFKKMLGYSEEEFPNDLDSFNKILHPDDAKKLWETVDKHFNEHTPFKTEYRLQNKKGEYIWMEAAGQAIWDENGKPARMVGGIVDINERKAVDRLKNEFISVVSHELRTPLTSIQGSIDLLLTEDVVGKLPPDAYDLLTIARNNSIRLIHLINDILDIEKIEAGKIDFKLAPVAIDLVVTDAIQANQAFSDKHHVILKMSPNVSTLIVHVDKNRLMQVLTNLISNAIKFSPKGETVLVSTETTKDNVRITIKDNGPGIPSEFQGRIFQKFSQADTTYRREKGGTGLGLSISKAIIEQMNGSIGFETSDDHGSTFYVDLPIVKSVLLPYQKFTSKTLSILLCEDDLSNQSLLKEFFSNHDCEIHCLNHNENVQTLLKNNRFDSIIIDFDNYPKAIPLLEIIRTSNIPNLPVIAISIDKQQKNSLNIGLVSILDWLEKPIDTNRLTQTIKLIREKNKLDKINILHVEDDVDLLHVVASILKHEANIMSVNNLHLAKEELKNHHYDLVILDLALPDGSGTDLLPDLFIKDIPVIVFTSYMLPPQFYKYITSSLTKAKISKDELLNTVKKIIKEQAQGTTHEQ